MTTENQDQAHVFIDNKSEQYLNAKKLVSSLLNGDTFKPEGIAKSDFVKNLQKKGQPKEVVEQRYVKVCDKLVLKSLKSDFFPWTYETTSDLLMELVGAVEDGNSTLTDTTRIASARNLFAGAIKEPAKVLYDQVSTFVDKKLEFNRPGSDPVSGDFITVTSMIAAEILGLYAEIITSDNFSYGSDSVKNIYTSYGPKLLTKTKSFGDETNATQVTIRSAFDPLKSDNQEDRQQAAVSFKNAYNALDKAIKQAASEATNYDDSVFKKKLFSLKMIPKQLGKVIDLIESGKFNKDSEFMVKSLVNLMQTELNEYASLTSTGLAYPNICQEIQQFLLQILGQAEEVSTEFLIEKIDSALVIKPSKPIEKLQPIPQQTDNIIHPIVCSNPNFCISKFPKWNKTKESYVSWAKKVMKIGLTYGITDYIDFIKIQFSLLDSESDEILLSSVITQYQGSTKMTREEYNTSLCHLEKNLDIKNSKNSIVLQDEFLAGDFQKQKPDESALSWGNRLHVIFQRAFGAEPGPVEKVRKCQALIKYAKEDIKKMLSKRKANELVNTGNFNKLVELLKATEEDKADDITEDIWNNNSSDVYQVTKKKQIFQSSYKKFERPSYDDHYKNRQNNNNRSQERKGILYDDSDADRINKKDPEVLQKFKELSRNINLIPGTDILFIPETEIPEECKKAAWYKGPESYMDYETYARLMEASVKIVMKKRLNREGYEG